MKATRKFKDFALKHAKIRKDKKVKGFTLVELIIVIAIIGILAAILIPTMTGKIKEAKMKTANDAAAKIAEQAAIILTDMMADGDTFGNGAYVAASNAAGAVPSNVKSKIENAIPSLKDGTCKWGFKVSDNAVVAAVYAKNNNDSYVGMYPDVPKEPKNGTLTDSSAVNAALDVAEAGGTHPS